MKELYGWIGWRMACGMAPLNASKPHETVRYSNEFTFDEAKVPGFNVAQPSSHQDLSSSASLHSPIVKSSHLSLLTTTNPVLQR